MYEVGDRVCLSTDPQRAQGTVIEKIHNRFYVRWDIGRIWIYPASWLKKI